MGNYGGQMGNTGPQQNFPGNQGPQQWGYNPQQAQQGYYGQQMAPVSRYERPQINQSKQALSNMLRQRHPLNQYMGSGGGATPTGGGVVGPMSGAYGGAMQRQFPRQQMRAQQQVPGPGGQQTMFQQQQQYGNMQGINQNYSGYGAGGTGNAQLMQQSSGGGGGGAGGPGGQQGMMGNFNQQPGFGPQGGNTGIGAPPNAAAAAAVAAATMMGNQRVVPPGGAQPDYLPQQQQQQQRLNQTNRPQYLQVCYFKIKLASAPVSDLNYLASFGRI